MESELLAEWGMALLGILALIFVGLHWRFHPQQTTIVSFEALKTVLNQEKWVLLQFHAPL